MIKQEINLNAFPNLDFVFVEGGDFMMGDNNSRFKRYRPEHLVMVPSFYMCKFQVTQQLWQLIMRKNPSRFKGEKRPVERISWNDANMFIDQLNGKKEIKDILQKYSLGKSGFRLPYEAEWEYAAKGGKYSQGYEYCGSDKLKQVGWYDENSNNETHEVGLLLANELGLYDMSGNVWEWCEDDYHETYEGAPKDGSAWIDSPKRGGDRVIRGGSSFYNELYCRPTYRSRDTPGYSDFNIGFRLVLPLQSGA